MRIYSLNSLQSFESHWRLMHAEFECRERLAAELCKAHQIRQSAFEVSAFSYPAAQLVNLLVDWAYSNGKVPNWRERLVCPITQLNCRLRATVQIIDSHLGLYPDSSIYITEQVTPLFKYLKGRFNQMIGSEFLAADHPSGISNSAGVRHEDLTRLSFADSSIEAVLSFECFEHIPNFYTALQECYRVLLPGGHLLFTVPFVAGRQAHTIRARMTPSGSIEHLMEPEYHGDPVQSTGCLCFTHFGWQLLDDLRSIGFSDPRGLFFWSREFGYLGDEQIFFQATKPTISLK